MGVRIGKAAARAGLPATAIRYYEDQGLIPPADRMANGYRTYDDRDIVRLQLVARARALGLPQVGLAEVVDVWEHDRCGPVADRLADKVDQHLSDTREHIVELEALATDLVRVRAQLARPAHDGPCVDGACACLDTPSAHVHGQTIQPPAVVCTLEPARMPDRLADWQRLLDRATERHPIPDGVDLRFDLDPDLVADLTTTAAAEHECCSFFNFTLKIASDHLEFHITGPDAAQPFIATVLGTPDPLTQGAGVGG